MITSQYEDPAQSEAIIADHEEATRFLLDHGGEILMTVPIGVPDDAPRWTLDKFKVAASTLTEIGKRALDMGATMALHPHWGAYVQSPEEIDLIMDLTDPRFYSSLRITAIFTIVTTSIQTVLGVTLALLLNRNIRGEGLVRTLLLIPWLVAAGVLSALPIVIAGLLVQKHLIMGLVSGAGK